LTKTFILWVHGASVIPEYTKAFTGNDNGLYIHPMGYGSKIKQRIGTDNWFHFAVPSGSKLCGIPGDASVSLEQIYLRFNINNGAAIKQITVHENGSKNGSSPKIYDSGIINITGQNTEYAPLILPSNKCTGSIVICVFIHWEAEDGEVLFTGAGARFEATE